MAERDNNQKNQGQGNFGNHDQHVEAGRMGGEATSANHDKSFYEEIGSEGGSSNSGNNSDQNNRANSSDNNGGFKKDDERTREAGREGGRNSHSGGNNR